VLAHLHLSQRVTDVMRRVQQFSLAEQFLAVAHHALSVRYETAFKEKLKGKWFVWD